MKNYLLALVFLVCLVIVPANDTSVQAASSDIKTSTYQSSFVFYDGGIYYNNWILSGQKQGIFKVSANMKTFKLIKEGSFTSMKGYKDSLIAFDDDNGYVVQLAMNGKVMKEFPTITSATFEVYGNHIYFYDGEDQSFYQTAIKSGTQKFLMSTPTTYVQEFTIHNGWLYFVHERYEGYESLGEHLSKIKISEPSKQYKLVNNVNNIDSIMVRDGFIYAVVHKDDYATKRNVYRMDYSGKNMKRLSTQDMAGAPFISGKHVYFVENSYSDNQRLYRMTLNGKEIKVVASLGGRPMKGASNGKNMYFEVQNGGDYFLKRISVK